MLGAGARHPDADGDSDRLHATLNEYLLLEHKYQPRLCLPNTEENGEVSAGCRDGAAHVMRCLKVWFDLPADVLINAINLFDRFLTKMKVRPCHVPCITVSCVNIAVEGFAAEKNIKRTVSIEELVSISQSACTAGDVSRMSRIIIDKLGLSPGSICTVTSLHWLRLLLHLLRPVVGDDVQTQRTNLPCQESELENLLEIVICDAQCANARTSELALVLLYHKLEQQLSEWSNVPDVPQHVYYIYEFVRQLQQHCHMSDASLLSVRNRVRAVVSQYEARSKQPQRQRLVWRLSERTLKVLRPTDRLTSLLPTIEEQNLAADTTPRKKNRSGSESSENEETSDWPRSPVLPVYCDN